MPSEISFILKLEHVPLKVFFYKKNTDICLGLILTKVLEVFRRH